MFFWLVTLLTFLTAPILLLLGRPRRFSLVHKIVDDYSGSRAPVEALRRALPWAARTPVVIWVAWPWTRAATRWASAWTMLGHVVENRPMTAQVAYHECIHVMQQSAHPVLGPIGIAVGYVLSVTLHWSWRKLPLPVRQMRAPLAEQIAYWLDGRTSYTEE